jgi:hypothetical protein
MSWKESGRGLSRDAVPTLAWSDRGKPPIPVYEPMSEPLTSGTRSKIVTVGNTDSNTIGIYKCWSQYEDHDAGGVKVATNTEHAQYTKEPLYRAHCTHAHE